MLNSTSPSFQTTIRGLLALACLALVSGCGGGYSGPQGTVTGTVTLNGNPVEPGTLVTFIATEGFAASGIVEGGGAYTVSIPNKGTKIPAVNYKVMVSAPVVGGVSEEGDDYEKYMGSVNPDATPSGGQSAAKIPGKYSSTGTSGLSFDVTEGDNTINIELN